MMTTCRQTAARLMAPGNGILAGDESIATMSSRLQQAGVEPSAGHRRVYRELLSTAPDLAESISGIIFCEETLNQSFSAPPPAIPSLVVVRLSQSTASHPSSRCAARCLINNSVDPVHGVWVTTCQGRSSGVPATGNSTSAPASNSRRTA